MFTRIAVAVDGTAAAGKGLETAIALAKEHGAALYVVHVYDELAMAIVAGGTMADGASVAAVSESLRESGRRIIAAAEKQASRAVAEVHAEMVESRGRSVASAILRHVKRVRGDLIVLGTHGRRGLNRLVMGSDAEAVVREATVPVLLVRAGGRSGAARPRTGRAGRGRRNAAAAATSAVASKR